MPVKVGTIADRDASTESGQKPDAEQAPGMLAIAPPTFTVVVALPASAAAAQEAFPGTGSPIVMHVEQRLEYSRPIRAGDVLHSESEVTSIREMRGTVMVTARPEIRAAGGQHTCTTVMTLAILPGNEGSSPPPHP